MSLAYYFDHLVAAFGKLLFKSDLESPSSIFFSSLSPLQFLLCFWEVVSSVSSQYGYVFAVKNQHQSKFTFFHKVFFAPFSYFSSICIPVFYLCLIFPMVAYSSFRDFLFFNPFEGPSRNLTFLPANCRISQALLPRLSSNILFPLRGNIYLLTFFSTKMVCQITKIQQEKIN